MEETGSNISINERLKRAREAEIRNFYYEKHLPLGIFECNAEGIVLRANDVFYKLLGVNNDEKSGLDLKNFFAADKRFVNHLGLLHVGESDTFSQLETTRGDKSVIYTRLSSYVRSSDDGDLVINGTLEDHTREVLLERKLNQSHRIETLGTLAGGIAHDFNTILTTITGYSELAMDELDKDSAAYDYITKILNSVNRAESIVNQVLAFSKQMDFEMMPVKIESLISEVCDFMQSALPFNIVLNCTIGNIGGLISADPTQLFRVFLNIITNSMQAMEDKGGSIDVKVSEIAGEHRNEVRVTISDTGTGIDKNILDRIYEPFFTTKSTGKGSGMGLAVVYGIISGMGAEIDVESEKDKGTTFTVSIPLLEENEIENAGNRLKGEHTERRILYIDNNIHFSRTVSLALERLGYNVGMVTSLADMKSYMNSEERIDTVFMRCAFDEREKEKILQMITEKKNIFRIILITVPGISTYKQVLELGRDKITILNEPVTLKDILNSL